MINAFSAAYHQVMKSPNPRQAVLALAHAQWTEARIAAAVGTSQSTIHRVKRGKQKSVSYELGSALLHLAHHHAGLEAVAVPSATSVGRTEENACGPGQEAPTLTSSQSPRSSSNDGPDRR